MQSRPSFVPARLNQRTRIKSWLGVVLALSLVHAPEGVGGGEAAANSIYSQSPGPDAPLAPNPAYSASLPTATQEMVQLLAFAARTCDVEALREAVELNELPPDFGDLPRPEGLPPGPVWDPLALWSGLAGPDHAAPIAIPFRVLRQLLAEPPVKDATSEPALFVWPAFSRSARSTWTVRQRNFEDRFSGRTLPGDDGVAHATHGPYRGPLLIIDAEGVWHTFTLGSSGADVLSSHDNLGVLSGAGGVRRHCETTR